jgi:hypothetical protein
MKSVCTCCGEPRKRRSHGRGWQGDHGRCGTCTSRWHAQGRPEGGPVYLSGEQKRERISAGMRRHHTASPASGHQKAAGRLQDYAWLVSFGEPRKAAAARVGVSVKTARTYDRALAAMADESRPLTVSEAA